jgi:ferredoxin-NADP reductase
MPLPEWAPGSHLDIHIDRAGEAPMVRQYSLCGETADRDRYRVAVLLEPEGAGGSRYLHEQLRQGQLVRVSEPRDLFGFVPAERMTFVAGGIGITPLLPMLAAADAAGSDWTLHYAVRSPEAMAFADELAAFGERVRLYRSVEGTRIDIPRVMEAAGGGPVYACGPGRLLDALEAEAEAGGVELRVERFANDQELALETDQAFEVELRLSGRTITVEPGETILQKVVEAGVPAPSSCLGGTCGTCETFVLEGEPDHRDAVLNAQEREESEVMMICVSRCKGRRLVLEL